MDEAGAGPNYCPNCGNRLDTGVNYCSQCGTRQRPTTPARDGKPQGSEHDSNRRRSERDGTPRQETTREGNENTEIAEHLRAVAEDDETLDGTEDRLAFRRRVQKRIADGWDLEHDNGDSVVLADRSLGEPWLHVVLLVFTSGLGNVAYGWYSHSYDADRVVLRADGEEYAPEETEHGTDLEVDDSTSELRSYVLGGLLLVIGAAVLGTGLFSLTNIVLAGLFLIGAAWSFPPTRRRLRNRHPVGTFGRTPTIEERVLENPETPCVVCGSRIEEGIERRYREEYVLAGVPLFETESGRNRYCRDCASAGIEAVGVSTPSADENPENPEGELELDR